MKNFLKDGERIDDLQLKLKNGKSAKIIQNPDCFCFGIDAVLLANMARVKKGDKVLDLCTGNGIVPLILAAKTNAEKIYGVEIQPDVANMAQRSVEMNGLTEKIVIECKDLKEYKGREFDVITCNPPYKEVTGGKISENRHIAIARTEICCTAEEVISAVSKMLCPKGTMFMIHRPERLADLIVYMRKYGVEPKSLRFIHPYMGKSPTMVFIEGKRSAKPKLIIEPPLYIYDENGDYTAEVLEFYCQKP